MVINPFRYLLSLSVLVVCPLYSDRKVLSKGVQKKKVQACTLKKIIIPLSSFKFPLHYFPISPLFQRALKVCTWCRQATQVRSIAASTSPRLPGSTSTWHSSGWTWEAGQQQWHLGLSYMSARHSLRSHWNLLFSFK